MATYVVLFDDEQGSFQEFVFTSEANPRDWETHAEMKMRNSGLYKMDDVSIYSIRDATVGEDVWRSERCAEDLAEDFGVSVSRVRVP